MRYPKGFIPVAIIILISFVAVAMAGMALWYKSEKDAEPSATAQVNTNSTVNGNTNVVINTNTAANANTTANTNTAVDETAGWKTYTNTDYGYSIRYPAAYTASGTSEHYLLSKGPADYISINSLTADNHQQLEASEFDGASGWYDWARSGFPDDGSVASRLSENKRQETLGENTFTVVNYDSASSWGGAPFFYFVTDSTVFLIVSYHGIDPNTEITLHEQIVETFTITSSDSTAGWKTYTNAVNGYSFKYPSEYTLTESEHVSIKKSDANMTVSIVDRKLDPNNILGIYGKKDPTLTEVGAQTGYQFMEGDAGCGGDFVQTALSNDKILQLYFGKCDQGTNILYTDIAERNKILSTFQFTE